MEIVWYFSLGFDRKRNETYWEKGGIEETRQKRQRISRDGTASIDETINTDDNSSDATTS